MLFSMLSHRADIWWPVILQSSDVIYRQVVLVVINTMAETLRPLTSNIANIAIIVFILYLIAVLNDDEVGKATQRLFQRKFPGLWEVLR